MSEKKEDALHTKFVTPEGTASYVQVWKMKGQEGEKKSYSMALLIPKSDKEGIKELKSAIKSAAVAFFGADAKKWPEDMRFPLRDGDKKGQKAYEGHFFFNARNYKNKPPIVDKYLKPIIDENEFYSGCKCRLSVDFFGYDKKSKGVGVTLRTVMKLDDGERLDNNADPNSEFAAYADTDPGATDIDDDMPF